MLYKMIAWEGGGALGGENTMSFERSEWTGCSTLFLTACSTTSLMFSAETLVAPEVRWRNGIDVTDDEEAACNEHRDCSVATLGFRRRRDSDAVRRDKEAGGRRLEAIDTLALYRARGEGSSASEKSVLL